MNLDSITYTDVGLVFSDAMKSSGSLFTYRIGDVNTWDTHLIDEISVDSDGWPLEIPYAAQEEVDGWSLVSGTVYSASWPSDPNGVEYNDVTVIENDGAGSGVGSNEWDWTGGTLYVNVGTDPDNGSLEALHNHGVRFLLNNCYSGSYTLLYDGTGTVSVSGVSTSGSGSGRTLTMEGNCTNAWINISVSDVGDPISNMRLIPTAWSGDEENMPTFNPLYTQGLEPFAVLRMMDFNRTNSNDDKLWADRRPTTYFSQGGTYKARGVAYEYMIELANTLDADIWLCVPHQASNNYIDSLATLLLNNLESERRVYLEFSNEIWNPTFGQYAYIAEDNAPGHPDAVIISGWSPEGGDVYSKSGVTTEPNAVLWGEATALSTWTYVSRHVYKKTGITTEPDGVYYDTTFLTQDNGETDDVGINEWDWTSADGGTLWINVGEDPSGGTVYRVDDTLLTEDDGQTTSVDEGEWDWDSNTLYINVGDDPAGDYIWAGIRAELAAIGNDGYHPEKNAYMMKRAFDRFYTIWSGQTSRIIRVVGTQTLWSANTERILDYLYDTLGGAGDAVAITGYFSSITEAQHTIWNADPESVTVSDVTDYVIDWLGDFWTDNRKAHLENARTFADERSMDLVVYEGGTYTMAYNESNWDYNQAVYDAHITPEMYQAYFLNFANLSLPTINVSLFNHYSYCTVRETKWGSWGALEDINDVEAADLMTTAPKYKALLDYIDQLDVPITIQGLTLE